MQSKCSVTTATRHFLSSIDICHIDLTHIYAQSLLTFDDTYLQVEVVIIKGVEGCSLPTVYPALYLPLRP